ncbi:MAG: restriction endonuclease [Syntrophaceae bacterium]|nr:restriction endonuclease [Syntrophaceae bacterium]
MARLSVTTPSIIERVVSFSTIYGNYNARGEQTSYGIDLRLPPLGLNKTIKSSNLHVLQCKVEDTFSLWGQKYERYLEAQKKEHKAADVDEMNKVVRAHLDALQGILAHTLMINDAVDWAKLRRKNEFRIAPSDLMEGDVPAWMSFDISGFPVKITAEPLPTEPSINEVKTGYNLLSKVFRKATIQQDYETRLVTWRYQKKVAIAENRRREARLAKTQTVWRQKQAAFDEQKRLDNEALEEMQNRYQRAEPNAIEDYCDLVLNNSQYPDGLPRNWSLEYRPESKLLVVALDLPAPDDLPSIESYRYVKTQHSVTEKPLAESARKKLYNSVLYQICLRTLHELLEADVIGAIDAIGFNGIVTARNKATGIEETKVILSVVTEREKFVAIDLANVDPKATFKHLKGVAAAELYGLTPIPPIIQLDKSDKRFIEGRNIDVDTSTNLAAMNWEDFEHLIRELFEQELGRGGEVRVTKASRDGGVDAVAFDPDPIRGGKIVIQAKRYTNTVGVSAVRDLYGTVMNEGATKGILVTTSNYGNDAYEFAKDKPLTLLNGSNLLALLERHGRPARIDIVEAKKLLGV